jgi:membrane protein DedA with SNARE-associated domain
MRFRNFLVASTVGTALWTTVLAAAGYKLKENFADINQVISPISNGVLILLVVAYAWRLLSHKVEKD